MEFSKREISILITPGVKKDIESLYHNQEAIKSFSVFIEILIKLGIQEYSLANKSQENL